MNQEILSACRLCLQFRLGSADFHLFSPFSKGNGNCKYEHDMQLYSLASNFLQTLKNILCSILPRALLATCFTLVSCLVYPSVLKVRVIYSFETSAGFSGLHSVIYQTVQFCINTYLRPEVLKISEPSVCLYN